jgi:hypothetical protein
LSLFSQRCGNERPASCKKSGDCSIGIPQGNALRVLLLPNGFRETNFCATADNYVLKEVHSPLNTVHPSLKEEILLRLFQYLL